MRFEKTSGTGFAFWVAACVLLACSSPAGLRAESQLPRDEGHAGTGAPLAANAVSSSAASAAANIFGAPSTASSASAAPLSPGSQGAASQGVPSPNAAPQSNAPSAELAPPSGACPTDMVLVAGDYCTQVEHTCVKHWYAESNKKDICEKFEPHSECVGEHVGKRYCIDRYDWPNRAGERPEVMNNFYQAQVKCAALGRRLCTESEWTMACEGPELLPFPYGYERDPNKCNGDREWDAPNMSKVAARDPAELARLWQGVRSGTQPQCVSGYGVWDLPGNNDEVASSETYGENFKGRYDSTTTGGPWYKGVRNQCRPKIYTHDEGFYYYYLGFRCCAEADGRATDPRAPKQVARNWDFEHVERLAGFTRREMQEKLQQQREGRCTCPKEGKLCKTMCGTLLGPETKDVVLGSPKPDANPPKHLRSDAPPLHPR